MGSQAPRLNVRFPPASAMTYPLDSYAGQMLVLGGYFVFVGFVAAALAVGLTAQDQYKHGLSRVNVISWTAAVTLVLLLLALLRSLI